MADLIRGANANITKEIPSLAVVTIGATWSTQDKVLDNDLLMGAVLCDSSGKAISDTELVFFNQLSNSTNTVAMGQDHHQVDIDLLSVPNSVDRVDIVLWINSAPRTMSSLTSLSARAIHTVTGEQLVTTENLAPYLDSVKAACLVQVYRHSGQWKIRSKGEGWRDGLAGMMKGYGLS